MTRRTHIAVGIAATLPLISYMPFYAFIGCIGATFPDIDIKLDLKHRTLTHSLIMLLNSTLLLLFLDKYIALVFFINFTTHLILDSLTKMGVPLFYPFSKKYYGFKLVKTGGAEDLLLLLSTIYLISCIVL